MANEKLVLVLPAYNEAEALPRLLARVSELRTRCAEVSGLHVVVVNDGSEDGTGEVVPHLDWVDVVNHPRNMGLAAAMRTGLATAVKRLASDGVVVVMDADDTHDPAAIPAMVAALEGGSDIVIGSRYCGGVEEAIPLHRRVMSWGAALLMKLACPIPGVKDYTCGYRAYRAGFASRIANEAPGVFSAGGFSVTVGLLLAAAVMGARCSEVPITVHYGRKPGKSKMRPLQTILGTLNMAKLYREARRGAAPWTA